MGRRLIKEGTLFSEKYVIIVAGGKGDRMKADIPKQFLLLNGLPILMHTINAFDNYDSTIEIIVVLPESQKDYWQELCERYQFNRSHTVVSGGMTRFHSVQNALNLIPEGVLVAIHDGVRPLVSKELLSKLFEAAKTSNVACPAIPVTDSIRKKMGDASKRVDRSQYRLMQTPQIFLSNYIKDAYKQDYTDLFTDDLSVLEGSRYCRPLLLEGSPENIKITTPIDLIIAEAILKCRI